MLRMHKGDINAAKTVRKGMGMECFQVIESEEGIEGRSCEPSRGEAV